jgi:DNA-binding MarR family transcriptional regulator
MPATRTNNLLGALAIGLADEMRAVAERQANQAGIDPAALCVIGHAPGLSITMLRGVLGLSHPGAVRLVDRLEGDGLVERQPAADGRAVALVLTRHGRRRVAAILAERARVLARVLDVLTAQERATLERISEKMLRVLPRDLCHALAVCRYCEEATCAPCPVEESLGAGQP